MDIGGVLLMCQSTFAFLYFTWLTIDPDIKQWLNHDYTHNKYNPSRKSKINQNANHTLPITSKRGWSVQESLTHL